MEIDLDKTDILNVIDKNFKDDVDFLNDIVYDSTTDWETYTDVILKLLEQLKDFDEVHRIEDWVMDNVVNKK